MNFALLTIYGDLVDDLEASRIATENRVRALREVKGMGDTPEERNLQALADVLREAEDKAVKELQKAVRAHPLGEWIAVQQGVGEKQAGRLLGRLGDPYWRVDEEGEVHRRTVEQLWSYCGYGDAERQVRRRGEKSSWNEPLKVRAYLIAQATVKAGIKKLDDCDDSDGYDLENRIALSPYGEAYLATRAKYAEATHDKECIRCGPSGKPAKPGSRLSKGHQHARALRYVAKTFLKDLYNESKRLQSSSNMRSNTQATYEGG